MACLNRALPLVVITLFAAIFLGAPSSLSSQAKVSEPGQHPLLIGYFPQWGLYDQPQYLVKNLVTASGAEMLDQVNYAQGFVTGGRCSIADPNADLNFTFNSQQSVDGIPDTDAQPLRGNLNQLLKLKRRFPHLKLVISLEGQAANFAADAQPENRQAFIDSCIDVFIKGNFAPGVHVPGLFDGIDIDWEFPHPEDLTNYITMLSAFREQLDAVRPGLSLNIAVGHVPRMMGAMGESELAKITGIVDQVGLMTYDYTGPWSHRTGFLAPFSAASERNYGSVQSSVQAYLSAGVPSSKLILGVPFYGYGWRLVPETDNGLFQEGEPIHGDRPYRYIETLIPNSTVYREPGSDNPWLFDGDAFWTYEDAQSIRRKADFAVQQQLGGVMIWQLGEDNLSGTLLQSAYQALHPPIAAPLKSIADSPLHNR